MRIRGALGSIAVVALLAAGCSSGAESSASDSGVTALEAEGAYPAADLASSAPDDGSGVVDGQTHVITEGHMTVTVDEPTEVVARVTQIVTTAGGYVESRSEQAPTDGRAGRAWLVLRIPASVLEETLLKIEELGELSSRETSSTDVSLQVADMDARIKALETSIERLLTMLSQAQRTEDLISLEETLQYRQSELDSLRAQRTVLGSRVALATMEVTFTSDPPPVRVEPGGFLPGVVAGWNSLWNALVGASVVAGVLLPWLAFFGVLGFIVIKVVKAARRRRPARPAVPAVYPPPAYAATGPQPAPGPRPHPYAHAPQPPGAQGGATTPEAPTAPTPEQAPDATAIDGSASDASASDASAGDSSAVDTTADVPPQTTSPTSD